MRHNYIYILLVIISVLFLSNCKHSTPTTDEDLFWMEHQGNFYTQDIDRAQDNIPLKILYPNIYLEVDRSYLFLKLMGH